MAGVSRHPSPASGPASRRWRAFVGAAALAVGLSLTARTPVPAAAADDGASVLERTYVDVAFVPGPGPTPDLLTLGFDDLDQSVVKASLLRRATDWTSIADATVSLLPANDGSAPWLVALGPDRYAVISTGENATSVTPITVVAGADPGLRVVEPATITLQTTDAGVADVDADGTAELVLMGNQGVYQDGVCLTPAIAVLPIADLSTAADVVRPIKASGKVPFARAGGAALGEWDGKPGVDLLVNAWDGCTNSPEEVVEHHHLVAIRLADGSTTADRPTSDQEMATAAPAGIQPTVVDVDGDGRNEAILATDTGFTIVDPVDRWRATAIGAASAVVIAATQSAVGGASVVWIQQSSDPQVAAIGTASIARTGGSVRVKEAALRPVPDASTLELQSAHLRLQSSAYGQQRQVLLTDVDGDGCDDIIAPVITIGCNGTGPIRHDRSWIGSRPLEVVGNGDDRRLLVAAAIDWYPYNGGPQAPAPAASQPPGAWRSGYSYNRFALAEVPLGSTGAAQVASVAAPTVDHLVSKDGVVEVRWKQGTHLLFRIRPLRPTATAFDADRIQTPEGFLYTEGQEGEVAAAAEAFLPPSSDGGSGTRVQQIDLRTQMADPEGGLVDRWMITVAALDATGALSEPVQGTALYDVAAPALDAGTPSVTPPWPFTAGLRGTSEPGVSVSLRGGEAVTVGPTGAFELPTQLAPWPQTLEVTAVDLAGNETTKELSIMGGIDIRPLPWPAMLVGLLLVGVVLSSLRGVRGTRPSLTARAVTDEVTPEIEELPVRPGRTD